MTSSCQQGRGGSVDEVEDGLEERERNTEGQKRGEGRERGRKGESEGARKWNPTQPTQPVRGSKKVNT